MTKLAYGIDFGTTNSSIGVVDLENQVRVLPIDPQADDPLVLRSAVYVNKGVKPLFGKPAVETYIRNVAVGGAKGTQSVFTGKYIKVGEEMVPEISDVEVRGYGYLFRSFKSGLARSLISTFAVFGEPFSMEILAGLFLREIKHRADQLIGEDVRRAVIGRPIRFVGDNDELALDRLSKAAKAAGFDEVVFEFEPIGAAWNYGLNTGFKKQTVLVFDFGGGTLDVSVVSFPEKKVLANEGLPIAGNFFNARIFEKYLAQYFGSEATYTEKRLPIPHYIYESLKNWYEITLLKTRSLESSLSDFMYLSSDPLAIKALRSLIFNNLGFELYETIEQSKKELSTSLTTELEYKAQEIDIQLELSREKFDETIARQVVEVEETIQKALRSARKRAQDIDVVATTGGSSLIPVFYQLLVKVFGQEKILSQETFTSVASGLALRAKEVFDDESYKASPC